MISRIVAIRDNRSSGQRCRGNLISAESVFDGAQALWFIRDEYVRGSLRRRRQKFVASSLLVRGNLPARGNFFFHATNGKYFQKSRKAAANPRSPRPQPRCISFVSSRLSFPPKNRTMAAYSRVNLRSSTIIARDRFSLSVENIYIGKKSLDENDE